MYNPEITTVNAMLDKKYNFTDFLKNNPLIDERDEESLNNEHDEVPLQVASKIK